MGYPDLQIKGRGRGDYPDPDVRRGGGGAVLGPQIGLKIRVRPGPPGLLPWTRH